VNVSSANINGLREQVKPLSNVPSVNNMNGNLKKMIWVGQWRIINGESCRS